MMNTTNGPNHPESDEAPAPCLGCAVRMAVGDCAACGGARCETCCGTAKVANYEDLKRAWGLRRERTEADLLGIPPRDPEYQAGGRR